MVNFRAWTIFKNDKGNCIILTFNHDKEDTVNCARWLYKCNDIYVRNIAPKLEPEFTVPVSEIKDLIFVW